MAYTLLLFIRVQMLERTEDKSYLLQQLTITDTFEFQRHTSSIGILGKSTIGE